MDTYLYEIKVVDKNGDDVRDYDVIAASISSALVKAEGLIRQELRDNIEYRISSIIENRVIDA